MYTVRATRTLYVAVRAYLYPSSITDTPTLPLVLTPILTLTATLKHDNNIQSETTDFAPGAATWRTGRNMHVVFDSGPFAPLRQNMTSFAKPEEYSEGIAAKRLQIYRRFSRRKNFKNRSHIWRCYWQKCNSDDLESPSRSFTYCKLLSYVIVRTSVTQLTRFQPA